MAEILAENLSGKDVMGTDGAELGSLYNITMDLSSGRLQNLVIDPAESVRDTDFEYSERGRLLVPVDRVEAVKDHMIVNRQMYVLDSSAFINEYHTDEQIASIPLVREELEDEAAYRFDALEGSGMHLHIPEEGTVERIERAARETGDLEELSATDVRLVAAAFELDGHLVTDDYAMQNVAEKLDVAVEVIAREGITEQRDWLFQCAGCGREFDEHHDRCPICGSSLSRKNPA